MLYAVTINYEAYADANHVKSFDGSGRRIVPIS
jgi:hypothetical protein